MKSDEFGLLLNPVEIKLLKGLIYRLNSFDDAMDLVGSIKELTSHVRDPSFLWTFVAINLARSGRIKTAIDILLKTPLDSFGRALAAYLGKYNTLEPFGSPFEHARAFQIWEGTSFQRAQNKITIEAISSFFDDWCDYPKMPMVRILDLGTGDGVFITNLVNEISSRLKLESVKLCLVDQSKEMLSIAREKIDTTTKIKTDIQCVQSDFIKPYLVRRLTKTNNGFDFAVIAASLHHVPRARKKNFIKTSLTSIPLLFVSELEGNHDKPMSFSPELYYSVYRFYGELLASLEKARILIKEKEFCRDHFLFAEALAILTGDIKTRGNYHTTIDEWKSIILEANCHNKLLTYRSVENSSLKTMAFAISS